MATVVGESARARAVTAAAARCSFLRKARTSVSVHVPIMSTTCPGSPLEGEQRTDGRVGDGTSIGDGRVTAMGWVMVPCYHRRLYDGASDPGGAHHRHRRPAGRRRHERRGRGLCRDGRARCERARSRSAPTVVDGSASRDGTPPPRPWRGCWLVEGVAKGDVVCLLAPSSIDYAVCYQAAARIGAITTGVNLRMGAAEQASIMARVHPAVTIVDTDVVAEDACSARVGHGRDASRAGRREQQEQRPAADSRRSSDARPGHHRVDERVDRRPQGSGVRPRQPARRRRGHRRALAPRRPSAVAAALRPRRAT